MIDNLLSSTKPVLYKTTSEQWPYALSGTCFPLRFKDKLYIVSAFHCFSNYEIEPKQLFYLSPIDDLQIRPSCPTAGDNKHQDQVILRVSPLIHGNDEIDRILALDVSDINNSAIPTSDKVRDIVLRGYPLDAPLHGIDFEKCSIQMQAFVTNGCLEVRRSQFDYCYYIKMIKPISDGMSPNGMSGSPVYGVSSSGAPVFCGMIIEYFSLTAEYLIIGPEVIVNCLMKQHCEAQLEPNGA